MRTFEESGLVFEFDDQAWDWVEYGDAHTDVKKISKIIQNTKSVDFIGFYAPDGKTKELALLEVKNYNHEEEEGDRQVTNIEEFLQKVVQKYRDILACALAGARNSTNSEAEWNTFIKLLTDRKKQLHAILFLEEDFSATGKNEKQIKDRRKTLLEKLKQKLNWLTGRVYLIDQQNIQLYGLTIKTI